MAKKRTQKGTNRLGDETIINPLNLDHVNAIGCPPKQPLSLSTSSDAVMEQELDQQVEHKPAPPMRQPISYDRVSRSPERSVVNKSVSTSRGRQEKDAHQIKTRFTVQEAEHIDAFRAELSARLGVKLRGSQISRALWTLALRAEEELDNVRAPELRRPSYGDPLGMAAFEDAIAEYLLSAIKKTRRLDI